MTRRIWAFLLAAMLVFGSAGIAEAKKKKKEDRREYTLSEPMAKKLTVALDALKEERYAEAEAALKLLEAKSADFNPYERALVYQMLGYVAAGRERYKTALV